MRKLLIISAFLLTQTLLFAQAPLGFNYQGIAREADGTPISNREIAIRVSIIDGPQGSNQFDEVHFLTTNDFGLFTAVIGQGNGNSALSLVNWAGGNLWLQIELDPDNSGNYILMGSQQLMSVPYALFAQESGAGLNPGYGVDINNGTISNVLPDRPITLTGKGNTTVTGSYPNFTIESTGSTDGDGDPTNEIQVISKSGTTVSLSNGGGSFIDAVDDADNDATNELQNLASSQPSQITRTISISGGASTTITVSDSDDDTSNELQDLSLDVATNNLQLTSGGTVSLSSYLDNTDSQNLSNVLGQGADAGNVRITNVANPTNSQDVVNLQYLEAKDATDYAFKSIVNDTGTGIALTFDLSTFDFDEGNLITTTQVLISEPGVYLFNIKGTSTSNGSLVINLNSVTDYPVGLINLGKYSDTIFLKLSAGDIIELRANSTGAGETFVLEFFGYKI